MEMKFLNSAEVTQKTTLSRVQVWRMVRKNEFPSPVEITEGRVGWVQEEVEEWMRGRAAARGAKK